MDGLLLALRLFVLLAVANGAPLVAKRLAGGRFAWPVDGGIVWPDGRPLLGASKTWRGMAAAVVACAGSAPLLGLSPELGALVGAGAMAGDALASFTKRRLGIRPSGRAFALDQVPEALVPLVLVHLADGLPWTLVLGITLAFWVVERPAAWLAWRIGLRDEAY